MPQMVRSIARPKKSNLSWPQNNSFSYIQVGVPNTFLAIASCVLSFRFCSTAGLSIAPYKAVPSKPSLLLCDEQTGNLDSKNSELVSSTLSELAKDYNSAMIVVTHDNNVASHFPRKIVIEDGRIIS